MSFRFDVSPLKATKTDEGYLVDSPVVGRVGIQIYQRADGTVRREFRPPEEVFNADSLASFAGKPVTDGHPKEAVTAKNAKKLAIGTIQSPGRQDGETVTADIIIHDGEAIDKAINGGKRELSLGYKVDLEEVSGEWQGQKYDAIQRNIRINHLAIVPRGRAGNARLNLDGDAVFFDEEDMPETLGRVRLDTGLEYQAAPEVIVAIEQLKADHKAATDKLEALRKDADTLTAERDTLKARLQSAEQVRADALAKARDEVKARAALDKVAEAFKIDGTDKTDREVKELVIKSVRADADLTGKSDDYVNAAFDLTVAMKNDVVMAAQRKSGERVDGAKPANTYDSFMKQLGNKEAK